MKKNNKNRINNNTFYNMKNDTKVKNSAEEKVVVEKTENTTVKKAVKGRRPSKAKQAYLKEKNDKVNSSKYIVGTDSVVEEIDLYSETMDRIDEIKKSIDDLSKDELVMLKEATELIENLPIDKIEEFAEKVMNDGKINVKKVITLNDSGQIENAVTKKTPFFTTIKNWFKRK